MKSVNELLIDIIYVKKRTLRSHIEELKKNLDGDNKDIFLMSQIDDKEAEVDFLEDVRIGLLGNREGLKFINQLLKNLNDSTEYKISKHDILKQLIKEYKMEYRKNYSINKKLVLTGIFDNNLFCEVIQKNIDKYTKCNKVTRKKYVHLTAFLNELLCEMQNSDNPLKTLRHRMRIYCKYKNSEYVEIRNKKLKKEEILKEILNEYKEIKNNERAFIR